MARVRYEVRNRLQLEGNPDVFIVSIDSEAVRRGRRGPDVLAQRLAQHAGTDLVLVPTSDHVVYNQALEMVMRKLGEMSWLASTCVVDATRAIVQFDEPLGLTGKRVTRTRHVRVLVRRGAAERANASSPHEGRRKRRGRTRQVHTALGA